MSITNYDLLAACSGCYNKSAKAAKALENPQERAKISTTLADMGIFIDDRCGNCFMTTSINCLSINYLLDDITK